MTNKPEDTAAAEAEAKAAAEAEAKAAEEAEAKAAEEAEAKAAAEAATAAKKKKAHADNLLRLRDTINQISLGMGFGTQHVIDSLAERKIKVAQKEKPGGLITVKILGLETMARGGIAEGLQSWCQAARRKLADAE